MARFWAKNARLARKTDEQIPSPDPTQAYTSTGRHQAVSTSSYFFNIFYTPHCLPRNLKPNLADSLDPLLMPLFMVMIDICIGEQFSTLSLLIKLKGKNQCFIDCLSMFVPLCILRLGICFYFKYLMYLMEKLNVCTSTMPHLYTIFFTDCPNSTLVFY